MYNKFNLVYTTCMMCLIKNNRTSFVQPKSHGFKNLKTEKLQ